MAQKQPNKPPAAARQETPVAIQNASLMARVANRYGVDPTKMNHALKQTAFRQKGKDGKPATEVTDEQMLMLMVVADQYKLNPFTREIYAFPSEGGIVAIVSVDGWIRIINERDELHSISFDYAADDADDVWIACTIERRDRSKPVTIREYLSECARDTKPWKDMPRRMLRHKALIQCARVAFGFAGIFDPDEAERIVSIVEQPTRAKIEQPREKLTAPADTAPLPEAAAGWISLDQATVLRDMIKGEGVDESLVLASLQVGRLDEIQREDYEKSRAVIERLSAEGARK